MSRKLIALDLALVALLAWAAFGLHQMWLAAKARETAALTHKSAPASVAPLAPLPKPQAVVPSKYKEIADGFLLDKSRNADVPVEPPPPPPPEPPMPALPVYHGVMNLGDGTTAFLSVTATSAFEMVHPGETIGQFKLLSVNEKEVSLEWHGKTVHKLVDELAADSQAGAGNQPQAIDARAVAAPAAAGAPAVNQPPEPPSDKGPGPVNQFGTAPCQQNDTSPVGTVRDGMRKISRVTPFGNVCMWESVGPR